MKFVQSALFALSVLAAPSIAAAQAAPTYTAIDQALAPEFAGWTTRSDIAAVGAAGDLAKGALTLGKAMNATLLATPDVKYVAPPEKPGAAASKGGLFSFTVARAGAYQIVLGTAPWVDVLKGGKAMKTLSFGHGPECTTIRKFVAFDLTPGRYVLQVSGAAEPTLAVMVTRKP